MELRRIIGEWNMVTQRLSHEQPELGLPLQRSCRPLAAERGSDGHLLTAIGCWLSQDLAVFQDRVVRDRLDSAIGPMLEDSVATTFVVWPAGLANPAGAGEEVAPPDLLAAVPAHARAEADGCESPLQRWFFGRAYAGGLHLACQQVIDHYRVDFVLPRARVGVEILGWATRHGPRERQRHMDENAWRILWFSGQEVHEDADRCVAALRRMLPASRPAPGRSGRSDRAR
jgi:very-short-patch-repair endonuclease